MKFFSIIFSILWSGIKSLVQDKGEHQGPEAFLPLLRSVVIFGYLGLAMSLLAVAGILIMVIDGSAGYDLNGYFLATSTFYSGLVLTLLGIAGMAIGLNKRFWGAPKKVESIATSERGQAAPSVLEHALSLLIADVIQERQQSREKEQRQQAAAASDLGHSQEQDLPRFSVQQ